MNLDPETGLVTTSQYANPSDIMVNGDEVGNISEELTTEGVLNQMDVSIASSFGYICNLDWKK